MGQSTRSKRTHRQSIWTKLLACVLATATIALALAVGPPPLHTPPAAEAVAAGDFMPLDGFPATNWPTGDPDFHYSLYNDPCETATDDVVTGAVHNVAADTPTQPLGKADICATHSGWFIDDDPTDLAAYGDMWICVAIDFPVDTGQTGFWLEFNQAPSTTIPAARTTGDLLIGFEALLNKPYSGTPDVYWWNEAGGGDPQAPNMIPAPLPLVFEASGGEKPPGVNFEICINMTDSGLIDPPCGFAGFGAYTQPSYGLTSETKDTIVPQSLDATNCTTIIVDKVGEGQPDSLADDLFTFDLLNEDGSPVANVNPGSPGGDLAFAPYVNPTSDLDGDGKIGDDYPLPTGEPSYANGEPYHPPTGANFKLASDDNHTSALGVDPAVGQNSGATFYVQAHKKYSIQEVAMEADWKFESLECAGDFASKAPTGEEILTYSPEPNEGTTYPYASPLTWDLTETSDDGTDSAWGAASPIAEFYPGPGGVVTCTFYNEQAAQIDIAKVSDPVDSTPFQFTAGNGFGTYDTIPAPLTNNNCLNPVVLTGGAQCSLGLVDADDTGWAIGELAPPSPYVNTGVVCLDEDGDSHGTSSGDFLAPTPYTASAIDPDYGDKIVCTFTNVVPDPGVGLAKALTDGPTLNIDGTAGIEYTLLVENTGNTTLNPVQVTDDLFATFGAASVFSNIVVDATGLCDTFENTAYDGGSADDALLIASPSLALGESCEIVLSFDVIPGDTVPGDNFGTTYENTATVTATDSFATPLSDDSTDGSDVDPEGDGAGDNSVPTPVSFAPVAEIGTAKQISAGPTLNADGTITLTYEMLVENSGDVTLSNVSLPDDLETVFGAGSAITIDSLNATAPLVANGSYDGTSANVDLLDGTGGLNPGESSTITLTITVKPTTAPPGPYSNTVTATGDDPWGGSVSDISDDGTDVDEDANGDPSDNSDPTVFSMPIPAEIGVAKSVTAGPTLNADGSTSITYTLVVENSGAVDLDPAQITDDLLLTFGAAAVVTNAVVDADDAGSCEGFENGAYNGTSDSNVFNGTADLPAGVSCTVTVSFDVIPGATAPGDNFGSTFNNTADASGTDPYGNSVTDASVDGTDPDPEDDGPGDNTSPTPVTFGPTPEMTVTKSTASGPTPETDGDLTGSYTVVVENTGDVDLDDVQITDDFATTFGAGTVWVNGSITADSVCVGFENDPAGTGSFDGTSDINLVAGGAASGLTLAPDDLCTFTITYEVTPGTPPAVAPAVQTYTNTAAGSGTDPYGNAIGDSGVTSGDVSFAAGLEVAKTVVDTTVNPDATMTVEYDITVTNPGDVDLSDMSLTDDLTDSFGVDAAGDFTAGPTLTTDPAACLATSGAYNGVTDTQLLTSGQTLAAGASCTINLVVTMTISEMSPVPPATGDATYTNTANAAGDNPYGTTLTGADTAEFTVVDSAFTLALGVVKTLTVGYPIMNIDGSYDVSYDIEVSNAGTLDIENLSVTDDITAVYGAGATITSQSVTSTAACGANSAWNGIASTGDTELVGSAAAGDNELLVAEGSCTFTVTFTVIPDPAPALDPSTTTYTNTADASGEAPGALPYTTSASDSEDSELSYDPEIGVAKTIASGPTLNADGTITLTYDILVENTGNVTVSNVQIPDDLEAVFGAGSTITIDALTTDAILTANTGAYDGLTAGDTNLLDGLGDLDPTESSTITLAITVLPTTALPGPYSNTVTTTGSDPYGQPVTDDSSDGTDVDPSADGDPTNDSSPTEFTLPFEAEIGVAKTVASGPTLNADGTITLTYDILVENTGNVAVNDIQIPEDLEAVYGAGSTITIDALTATAPLDTTTNGSYTGLTAGDTNLLDGTGDLAPTESSTISLTITVLPTTALPGPYQNSVTATGSDPYGNGVTDTSQDGTDADPDTDGDPTNNSTPTEYSIPFEAEIGVAKSVTAGPTINADGTASITYTLVLENLGNVNLDPVQVTDNLYDAFGAASVFSNIVVDADDAGVCEGFESASYDGGDISGSNDINVFNAAAVPAPELAVGEACSVDISFDVIPGATAPGDNFGTTYNNTADASGTDPYGNAVTDESVDGTDPDPGGDGGAEESSPTPVSFNPNPQMTVTKAAGTPPTPTAGGNLTGTYAVTVANSGNTNLNNLQLTDDFESTFGTGTTWVTGSVSADSVCASSENTGYAGVGAAPAIDLVAGGAASGLTLAPSDVCIFTITYEVTPGTPPAVAPAVETYTNTATGTSTDPYGNNIGDSGQTSSDVSITPGLDLTKNVTTSSINADGTMDVAYDLQLVNTGGVDLTALTLVDDMTATFGIDDVGDFVSGPTLTVTPAACLPTNGSYDGVTDTETLATPNTLAASANCTVTVTATITIGEMVPLPPLSGDQVYTNTATTSGSDPYGGSTGDTDSGALTIVDAEFTLSMAVTKTMNVGYPVFNTDGTTDVSYDIEVSNTGTLNIDNLGVTDDVLAVYGAAATITSQLVTATAPCSPNSSWTGEPATDIDLLVGTDTLLAAPGTPTTCTITVDFTVLSAAAPAVAPATTDYTNTANADGHAPGISSLTAAGSDTESYDASYNPELGVAKDISVAPVLNADGTITLTYAILVENTGDVTVTDIQVPEDLEAVFGPGSTVTIDSISATTPLTENAGFTGTAAGDTNLLDGLGDLAPTESSTITLAITVKPADPLPGPFDNTVTATGSDPWGNPVADISTDGADTDPNNDGSTRDNSVPTSFSLPFTAEIGVAKQVTAGPTVNADGSFALTYTFVLENFGDVNLDPVNIADNLYTTFGAASQFANIAVDADDAGVCEGFENTGFDGGDTAGDNDTDLFNATAELAVGEVCSIDVSFDVTPGATAPGDNFGTTFNNTATATGTDPYGNGVTDDSVDGADADPGDDGSGEESSPTPVSFAPDPKMTVTKAATSGPDVTTDGNFTGVFEVTVTNTGDVNLYNLQLTDDFETTFGTGTSWVSGSALADSVCNGSENAAYVGLGTGADIELVDGGATSGLTLAPSDVCVFTITYEIDPGTAPAVVAGVETYTNTANGTSTDPYGNTLNESGQTSADVSYANGLELTKGTVSSTVNADGTLDVSYDLVMHNPGEVDLSSVQISDDLTATFGIDDATDIVSGPTLVADPSGCFAFDVTYDGVADITMLDAGNTLDALETCKVTLSASLTIGELAPIPPASGDQVYTNTAEASGTDPFGRNLADSDTADVTIIDGEFTLAISTVKTLEPGYPVLLADGSFDLVYNIEVANGGTLNIDNLTVTDDVIAVYGAGSIVTGQTVTASAPCSPNSSWTGDPATDIGLLVGTDTLEAAPTDPSSCTITVAFNVKPPVPPAETPATTVYTNTANAGGHAPGIPTITVADSDTADSIIGYNPEIGIAKQVSDGPTFNIDGSVGITYSMVVTNTGDVDLTDVLVTDNLLTTFGAASIFTNVVVDADDAGLCEGFENPTYDAGALDANLFDPTLIPGAALAVGESCTLTVSFDVVPGNSAPGDNFGTTYNNTATAAGTDPYGVGVTDDSTDGSDPDPGADGSGDDSVPTPVSFAPVAELSTTKAIADGPVLNADGTMTLTYSITVANTGDVTVADVQVPDDLEAVFGTASTITVDSLTASSPLVANDPLATGTYNGLTAGDLNLVDGLVALDPGESSTIELAITVFSTIALPGPFENSVTATGTDPWGGGVEDTSNDGADADPDDDGDPSNNSTPTAFELPYVSELGVAKAVTDGPYNNGDGSYTLTYQFVVTNLGTVTVSNLQLTDDVESTYGAGSTLVIDSLSATSPYVVNSAFNGLTAGDTNLLAGTDSLVPAATVTIDLTITVTPVTPPPGPYDNVATASGTDPYGDPVVDDSISGTDPDPDGDGSGAETGPTTVGFGFSPVLGVAKEITDGPTLNADGSFTVTYSFVAANLGDVNVDNVQLDDDLENTFGAGVQVTVDSLTAELPLVASSTFDGVTDIGLLSGIDTLAVGETSTIVLTITVIPTELGVFENTAVISGTDPRGAAVSDDSVNGADPDPDGTGDAAAESPTPLGLAVEPEIAVAKRVVGEPEANSDGSFRTTFELVVANVGPIELTNVNVTDDLQSQWTGAEFNVISVASSTLTVNSGFNGKTDINLLAAVDTIAPGDERTITLVVDISRPSSGADLANEAGVTGDSPYGAATALSANGTDPSGSPSATPLALPAPSALPFVDVPLGLPRTGGEALRMLGLGFALTAAGGGLWFLAGRRRREDDAQTVDAEA